MALKLPTAMPKALHPLSWVILAARTDGETEGVTIDDDQGKIAVATDGGRMHVAHVATVAVGPGCYDPPGWGDPDWHQIEPWTVDWRGIAEHAGPTVAKGHVVRVDMLYGICRAAIAYAQSSGLEVGVVYLQGMAFNARFVADAISGSWGDIMGCDLVVHGPTNEHKLNVTHSAGEAWAMGLRVPANHSSVEDPKFDGSEYVVWEE